jgi:hypothetical protein
MLDIFGESYYIDLKKIEEFVELKSNIDDEEQIDTQVNLIKFDTVKMLLEVLLNEVDDGDEKMGFRSNDLSVSFKLAFNTLLNYKILNKY